MHRKSIKGWAKHIDFLLVDMIALEISFLLAYIIRHGFDFDVLARPSYKRMFFVLLLIDFVSTTAMNTFSGILRRGFSEEIGIAVNQSLFVTLFSSLYLFVLQEGEEYSRITLVFTGIFYLLIGVIARTLWKNHIKNRCPNEKDRAIVIVAQEKDVEDMISTFNEHDYSKSQIRGIILTDASRVGEEIMGIPVIADKETALKDEVTKQWIDEILFSTNIEKPLRDTLQLGFLEMGLTVHQALIKVINESSVERHIERVGGYTVITRSVRILTTLEILAKRTLDIFGAIIGCIVTILLCIIIGPIIYINSPGPIFFTQERIGRNGRTFKMYKFRSMYLDAEERLKELKSQNKMENDLMFKIDYDPRIIGSEKGKGKGIGNFIRKTSIDEFPQFWNVLIGDMSIVGTRPPLKSEWEQYERHHRARMAMKPGITGMWQVSGRSNITNFEEVVDLDMEYIENWSFFLDIKIILKTVLQIFKKEGAA